MITEDGKLQVFEDFCVDEVCDLTLDKFADAVGASAVKEL